MAVDAATVEQLVDAELVRISDPMVAALIEQWRVSPRCELRPWSYSETEYPCWLVLENKDSNVGVAYCERGFGPKCPWGLLWLTGDHLYMGDDSQWFSTIEDAVRDMIPVGR
jgi:hypothetical protein